jgi:hypothetical protein
MTARLDALAAAPQMMKIWFEASLANASSLDQKLAELVKIRASQINSQRSKALLNAPIMRCDGPLSA